jgi:RimJ/RimL family protein N-acetyltransferase
MLMIEGRMATELSVQIVYPTEQDFAGFREVLGCVAKERVHIEMIEAPPIERLARFQQGLIDRNAPVYYAVHDSRVIGWCDITPQENPRQRHRGSLGMGLLAPYRGQGVGSKLLQTTLSHAKRFGLEKVELHVYTSNLPAIVLYQKFGFVQEGLIRKYRRLDGIDFDCLAMAKFL